MAMTAAPYSAPNTDTPTLWELPVEKILPSPLNPRRRFDADGLAELAESIRQHGLLEPIVVRYQPDQGETPYELIAGERRWRATQLAGLATIQARVLYQVDDATALKLALIENLQRRDLDPIEEAEGYRQLNRVIGLKQGEIAAAVNRSQPAIANAMRLLDLPEDVQERIRSGELSVSHGIALARFKGWPKLASAVATAAVKHHTTAKDLEKGIPFHWELESRGIVRRVDGYHAHFDTTVCRSCPFEAYRKGDLASGWCLSPTHWDQLQAEADQRRHEEMQATLAAAQADNSTLVSLKDLNYGTYEDLRYLQTPPGCSEQCVCRGVALSHNGSEIVAICTDPPRFRQLKAVETRAANKDKRAEGQRKVDQIEAALDGLEEPGERELILLAAAALTTISKRAVAKAAAEHVGVGDLLNLPFARYELRRDGLRQLAALDPTDLVKLAVEAVLRDEIASRYEGYNPGTEWTDWYLEETEASA